jgi:ABC-type multidrug transport system ATPase subunit
VIGGAIAMSEGEIRYSVGSRESGVGSKESSIQHPTSSISPDLAFKYISIAAPYLEVIEEMTAVEFLDFHRKFKPLLPHFTIQQVLTVVGLHQAANKQIRYYSSGMKQRIKLAQAFFSDTPV